MAPFQQGAIAVVKKHTSSNTYQGNGNGCGLIIAPTVLMKQYDDSAADDSCLISRRNI